MGAPSDRLVLDAQTAEDLMTPNPVSIGQEATVWDAANVLTDKQISAVPVINDAGRPVGVFSRTDIVRYVQGKVGPDLGSERAEPPPEGTVENSLPMEATDLTAVRDIMTPAVLSVPPKASAMEVVGMLVGVGRVHRLFVVDEAGVLVGVISAMDVVRKLRKLD